MKKRLSTVVLLIIIVMMIFACDMTAWQEVTKQYNDKDDEKLENMDSNMYIGERLKFDELEFRGVKLLMTENQVVDLIGEPIEKESYYEEALGYNRMIYTYNDCELLFDKDTEYSGIGNGSGDYMVSKITLSKPKINCVRGTQIEDTLEAIVSKFEGNLDGEINGKIIVLYGDDWTERGTVTIDDNMNAIDVLYGVQGDDERIYYLDYWFENGQVKTIIISVDIGLC